MQIERDLDFELLKHEFESISNINILTDIRTRDLVSRMQVLGLEELTTEFEPLEYMKECGIKYLEIFISINLKTLLIKNVYATSKILEFNNRLLNDLYMIKDFIVISEIDTQYYNITNLISHARKVRIDELNINKKYDSVRVVSVNSYSLMHTFTKLKDISFGCLELNLTSMHTFGEISGVVRLLKYVSSISDMVIVKLKLDYLDRTQQKVYTRKFESIKLKVDKENIKYEVIVNI